MRETLFPVVYPTSHYNGDSLNSNESQFMYNIDALRMGPVRMKQNREVKGPLHEHSLKKLPRPEIRNGWVHLIDFNRYCYN